MWCYTSTAKSRASFLSPNTGTLNTIARYVNPERNRLIAIHISIGRSINDNIPPNEITPVAHFLYVFYLCGRNWNYSFRTDTPGESRVKESGSNRSFCARFERYHRAVVEVYRRPKSLAHVSCQSVCGGCTSGLVACGEGCTRMFHGASGLGVARGRNKKGTGVFATLLAGVCSLHSPVSIDVYMERPDTRATVGTGEPERQHRNADFPWRGVRESSSPNEKI